MTADNPAPVRIAAIRRIAGRCLAAGLSAFVLFGLVSPALAGPHPAYVPHRLVGLPTYKQRHLVGHMVFALAFPDPARRTVNQAVTALHFTEGLPPVDWWGRSYYACTLREAIASLPAQARQFRLATICELNGERQEATAFDIEEAQLGPQWNTTSFDGSFLNAELARLPSGTHSLIVWRQINYREPRPDRRTGEVSWEPASLILSKGTLPIIVRP